MEKIAMLISGGVDSAVATHLLCEEGYKPDLYYIKIGMKDEGMSCTAEEDIELSEVTARRYGLHLEVIDLQQEYWDRVVTYTIDRVRRGLTPNPDVMCNRLIKFGCFEERVGKDYDVTATGHYATTPIIDGMKWLGTAKDPIKDQTDFLAQLDNLQLQKLRFPLGLLMKEEVRAIAREARLPSANRKDSQGICFLGKINYNDFIARFMGEQEGPVIERTSGRVIGEHKGYWFHTIGQRRGLHLGGGPWYVVGKDIARNIVYVEHGTAQYTTHSRHIPLKELHYIVGNPWEGVDEQPIQFKIRHTEMRTDGLLIRDSNGQYRIESGQPVQGVAPEQFAVVYNEEGTICVGSGEIGT